MKHSFDETNLPEGWKRLPFTELAEVLFSGVDKKTSHDEIKVRLCNYVDVFHNNHILRGINFMEATASETEISNFELRRGDVVFTKDSETPDEIAEPAYVAEDLDGVICGYHLGIARPKENVDGLFLYYAMKEPAVRRQFSRAANGVTRFGLTLGALKSVIIPTPTPLLQRRIAAILSTWDETSQRVARVGELLETQYRAVAAQYISLRGNNMLPLRDLLTPDLMEPTAPNGPFRAMGVRSHGKGTFQREEILAALDSGKTVYRVEPGRFVVNIVFAWEGAAAVTTEEDAGCLVSHRFPTFTINRGLISVEYFRHLIRTDGFRQLLALASPGGAGRNKTLNRSDLLKFEIHLPPMMDQEAIADTLGALDRRLKLNARYLDRLVAQRNALATELLTGRLRVREAEADL